MYVDGDGKDYSKGYVDEGYNQRVEDIYLPKADFLSSSLPKKNYEILDVGCGAGHFVLACSLRNLKATGIDVSKVMIDFGNQQIRNKTNDTLLRVVDENSIYEEVKSTNAEVISAIGVIEHVREPRKFFEAFKQSRARYLFYEVPMFSLSALLENVSPKVFPRLLSGGHTHLFTENSLQKMNELMNVKTVAQWRFGADAQDLLRHLLVNLELNGTSKKTVNILENTLGNGIDEIQSVIDKNHFCSETHAIVERC
jgi:SAM-dependent methyltransferase